MRERREKAHGIYRNINTWRVVIVAANGSRCTETFASEKAARARITEFEHEFTSFEREFTSRTIASAVDAYLAAQERRVHEGELRTSTVEREGYHLRATLKLAEYGQLDVRRLNSKLAPGSTTSAPAP